jgi:hypothetical protein
VNGYNQSNEKIEDEPALSDEDFLAKLKSYPDYSNQTIPRLNLTEDNDAM